jgi:hypothetical protein
MRFQIVRLEERLAPSLFGGFIDISHTDHSTIIIHTRRVGDVDISHTDHTYIDIDGHVSRGADIDISHTDHSFIRIGGR